MDLHLTRIDEPRNMARYYALEATGDLFGGAVMIRRWGRIGSTGRDRREWFADPTAAHHEAERWRRAKVRRGYQEG
ncbi:MAG: WGR domain-containing protein [Paracoccus sp. (in: a-proteobacteria)]|nr:WGR domain-containing protein [Paracoccus sp. (in: a-proteobacteria)]